MIKPDFYEEHFGFQKYLDDAMGECNETQVGLCQCRDIYAKYIDVKLCEELINEYDIIGKQLYRLEEAWGKFFKRPKTKTND